VRRCRANLTFLRTPSARDSKIVRINVPPSLPVFTPSDPRLVFTAKAHWASNGLRNGFCTLRTCMAKIVRKVEALPSSRSLLGLALVDNGTPLGTPTLSICIRVECNPTIYILLYDRACLMSGKRLLHWFAASGAHHRQPSSTVPQHEVGHCPITNMYNTACKMVVVEFSSACTLVSPNAAVPLFTSTVLSAIASGHRVCLTSPPNERSQTVEKPPGDEFMPPICNRPNASWPL